MKKTLNTIKKIVGDITPTFQGQELQIFVEERQNGDITLQVGMMRPDINNPQLIELGKGGKAYLSYHSTEDEIVKKVLGLVLAYVEHEVREGFTYKGVRLFGPHISIEAMMFMAHDTTKRN